MFPQWKNNKGVSIIEIIVVIAILGIALVSLLTAATFSLRLSIAIKETSIAKDLAEESMEGARSFRDGTKWSVDGLGSLQNDVSYHLVKTGTPLQWSLVPGQENISNYVRKIVLGRVYRDINDNISLSGSEDLNTKKVTVTVSFKGKKVELTSYLMNYKQ